MAIDKRILASGLSFVSLLALAGNLSFTISSDHPNAIYKLGDRVSSRQAGWPRMIDAQLPENRSAAEKNAPYFCGVNFARHIDVPIGFVVGFIDTVCPPHAGYAAYNVCPSAKKAMFHSIGWGHNASRGNGGNALRKWMVNQQ